MDGITGIKGMVGEEDIAICSKFWDFGGKNQAYDFDFDTYLRHKRVGKLTGAYQNMSLAFQIPMLFFQ